MAELDTTRAPRGVLAAQALVAAVAEHGDLAERHYLELKSTLNLSGKKDKEKIAKFILGAANRMPDVAASAFEGYGVMMIGVAKDAITGIPPVEMMEISKVIQQYLGAAGPRWDIVWVPIKDSSNQVLVILVDPPQVGQGPFPCRANGESLTDGRVYLRADGETREAKADELLLLIERGVTTKHVEVDFGVEFIGEIAPVTSDESQTVEEYIARVRKSLVAALPSDEPEASVEPSEPQHAVARMPDHQSALGSWAAIAEARMEPEKRTREQYLESIDVWAERFRAAWDVVIEEITASQLEPVVVRIVNRTTTFFHDVEVHIHLEGDVFGLDYIEPESADDLSRFELPRPPRKWGPWQRPLLDLPSHGLGNVFVPGMTPAVPSSIRFKNGGSVDLDLDVGELRPRGAYVSEEDEMVIFVADGAMTSIRGTWELTARDHNEVYAGEIEIPVAPVHDLTEIARSVLRLERGAHSEGDK